MSYLLKVFLSFFLKNNNNVILQIHSINQFQTKSSTLKSVGGTKTCYLTLFIHRSKFHVPYQFFYF
jgi:hypothetical protein